MNDRIFKLVEERENPGEIIRLAGFDPKEAAGYTFESASFVFGMNDGRTVTEVCFCPEGIDTYDEPENPVFGMGKGAEV